jgi:hypothetical protein
MSKTVHSVKLEAYDSVDLNRVSYSNGEVVFDNTNNTLRLMNGITQGGTSLATQAWVQQQLVGVQGAVTINPTPPTTTYNGALWLNSNTGALYVFYNGSYVQPSSWAYGSGGGGGSSYVLPVATTSSLGGVIVDGTTITIAGGVISAAGSSTYTLPTASISVLGGVKIDNSTIKISNGVISANLSGYVTSSSLTTTLASYVTSSSLSSTISSAISAAAYSLPTASTSILGGVIVDGTTITINNGVITANYTNYSLPTATTSVLGGVKIDGTSIVINNGVISVPSVATIGIASGIATLDSTGHLTASQIPTSLTGAIVFKGTWNASTNSPTLSNGTGTTGWEYAVSVSGTALGFTFNAGDFVIYNGSTWQQIPGSSVAAAATLTGTTLASNVVNSSLTSVGTLTNLTVTNTITGSVSGSAGSVAAGNITGTTLASNVTGSSLTSVGTITSGTWHGTTIQSTYLPTGSSSALGIVQVDGTTITSNNGIITAVAPTVVTNSPGSEALTYSSGTFTFTPYALPTATTSVLGGVKVDGTTITITGGVITSTASAYSLPAATTSTLGGVTVDGSTITVTGGGQISATQVPVYGAITTLVIGNVGSSAYTFSQYTGSNPTIYGISGTTLAFKPVGGHPFQIQTSGGVNLTTGLIWVSSTGTVLTGSSAQGQTSGTLYWQIPIGGQGNYKYQCGFHAAMNGVITVVDITTISTA